MSDSPPLFDPYDKPLKPKEDRPLSVEIQTAVRVEVNTAMDNARQHLNSDFDRLRKGSLVRYGVTVAVGVVVAILGYLNLLDKAENWTRARVDQKMDDPMIQEASKKLMDSRIAPYISNEVVVATLRIERLNLQLTKIEEANRTLSDKLEFNLLANNAQLYDRDAYETLASMGAGTNAIVAQARRIVSDIQRRLESDRFSFTVAITKEQSGDSEYTGPFTSDEIAMQLRRIGLEGTANYIRNHKLKLFVPELIRIALTSKDLWEANRITFAISELTGQKFFPWTMSQLTNWWENNKLAYTNWPFTAFDAANGAFSGTRYGEALTNFQAVLAVDKAADTSRMCAIACALESSNVELATNLFSHFADPNGRWRKLAEAKMCASTGDVRTATSILAGLSTNYPTFRPYSRESHVWRQIDWTMYDNLIAKTNTSLKKAP